MSVKVLVNGQWVEKPVKYGYPNWRETGVPPVPAWTGAGLTKNNAMNVPAASGTSTQVVSGWRSHPNFPGSTVSSQGLAIPYDIPPGRYRIRVRLNPYNGTRRGRWYCTLSLTGSYARRVADAATALNSGADHPEYVSEQDFVGNERLYIYVYQESYSQVVDETKQNYVIVEPL